MPDQSSASTEFALMQEITAPLATLPDDPLDFVADPEFPIVLRGYDRDAVDEYVRKASQLVAELHATRSPEAAIKRAVERFGQEVSGVLSRAQEAAGQITAQSRIEAEDRLEAARREAAQIIAAAEARVRELDAETDRIWAERHRIVEDTRELARELLTMTDSAANRFPPSEEPAPAEAAELEPPPAVEVEPEDARPVPAEPDAPDVEPTVVLPVVEASEEDVAPAVADDPAEEDAGAK